MKKQDINKALPGILTPDFFTGDVVNIAQNLLGKFLVRKENGVTTALMIEEVEAYDGEQDLACHASKGRTQRTEVLFGPPGYFYVYLCYGMHWLLNIVTGPQNYPAAVLIRGAGGIIGPARITKALHIHKDFHNTVAAPETGLWFEDRGKVINKSMIKKSARIGVDYAGPYWSKIPYRFYVEP